MPYPVVIPPGYGRNGGYTLDQLLQIVAQLESSGLLADFLRSFPQYTIGVEVARQILQRNRNSNFANARGLGAPTQAVANFQGPCQRPVSSALPAIAYPTQNLPCCRRNPATQQMALASSQRVPGTHLLAAGPPGASMMSGPLHQRLTQIQEPPPCLLQHPGDHQHVNFPRTLVSDGLTLTQRLARIPEPTCQHCQAPQVAKSNCPYFPRTVQSHERDTEDKQFNPVAAGFSDGIGGHKIKGFPVVVKTKVGSMDGVGGRKVKGFEEE